MTSVLVIDHYANMWNIFGFHLVMFPVLAYGGPSVSPTFRAIWYSFLVSLHNLKMAFSSLYSAFELFTHSES